MARSMFHGQKLNKSFWMEAVVNAIYTRNRCPTRALNFNDIRRNVELKEVMHCTHETGVFGCIVYTMMLDAQRGKLDANDTKHLFFCYCEGIKAFRLMCLQNKKIIKSRDVIFIWRMV